jgi:hypothetical protein
MATAPFSADQRLITGEELARRGDVGRFGCDLRRVMPGFERA